MTGPGELRVRLARVLPAGPEVVFAMHTDPTQLARWWGPKGFAVPSVELDPRVGGRYRIAMQPPDGAQFFLSGEFLDIDPPRRLAYTFLWEPPDPDDRATVAELSFAESGPGRTELVVDHGVFATEQRRALHEQGWDETLDRLHELITHPSDRAV